MILVKLIKWFAILVILAFVLSFLQIAFAFFAADSVYDFI